MGGVTVALALDALTASGISQASVDEATGKVLTIAAGAVITRHEFEENTCSYSDSTTIGNNRYPKHLIGFKLAGRSEVNANPKDGHDYPEGVWTLPPRLAKGDVDRAKFLAIGESDRMTLRFVKPANP